MRERDKNDEHDDDYPRPALPFSDADVSDALAGLLRAAPNAHNVSLEFDSTDALRLFASCWPRGIGRIQEVCMALGPVVLNASQVQYTDFLTAMISDMRARCGGHLRRFQFDHAMVTSPHVCENAAEATVQMRFP